MPRLGDLLVQAGRVTPGHVEEAARAQVAYGGRIGTCLVELDHLEIDELAAFLGRQHHLPPASRMHFDKADAALQALLPGQVAVRRKVVPIARIAGDSKRIAIASMGPITPDVLLEIALHLRCEADDLVVAVAAELRILYNLERVYGIRRPTRFLRTKRAGTDESVSLAPPPITDSGDNLAIPKLVEDHVSMPIAAEDAVLEIAAEEPTDGDIPPAIEKEKSERRRYARTIADDTEPPATHPAPEGGLQQVGRISLVKIPIAPAVEGVRGGATTSECLRSIRRCRDREQIGALAIDCLERNGGDTMCAGVLFIARGPIAVGWKGFVRGAELAVDHLAVPLDEPSVLARETGNVVRRLAPATAPLCELDQRLVDKLAVEPPGYAIAVPIAIKDHLIGYIYCQGRTDADEAERLVVEVADATRGALTSLLRAAQR